MVPDAFSSPLADAFGAFLTACLSTEEGQVIRSFICMRATGIGWCAMRAFIANKACDLADLVVTMPVHLGSSFGFALVVGGLWWLSSLFNFIALLALLRRCLRTQLIQSLLDHARGVDALRPRIDQLPGHDVDDLILRPLQFGVPLLLADL